MKKLLIYTVLILFCTVLYAQDTISTKIVITTTSDTVSVEQTTDTFVKTGEKPLQNLEQQLTQKPAEVLEAISFSKIFWTIVLLVIGFLIIQIFIKLLEVFAERSTKYRISIKSFIPIVRIVIWSIIIFAIVKGIYNPPLQTLIAISASITIAVGLAAQDLLKNVFGGLMLLFDRPFQVGDKIETGKYYGEVLSIGLRATRIVTPDDSVVSVPNMELMNSSVSLQPITKRIGAIQVGILLQVHCFYFLNWPGFQKLFPNVFF